MSIAPNKVIIPNDYKEIIYNKTDGENISSSLEGSGSSLGGLRKITIDLPNLNLNISPKMSYVAEVCYICKQSNCEIILGNKEGETIDEIIEFDINIDKYDARKYRFFRFSLTPNIDIHNGTEELHGPANPDHLDGPLISLPCPMRVYIQLNFTVIDPIAQMYPIRFSTSFTRSLTESERLLSSGSTLMMSGIYARTFKFIFDTLNGTIIDETPDVFGKIMGASINPSIPSGPSITT